MHRRTGKEFVLFVLNRTAVLYALAAAVLYYTVDKQGASLKILNHMRNSARQVNMIAEFASPYNEKEVYEAIDYCQRLLKLMPNRHFAYGVLGYSHNLRGETDKAISAFESARKFLPKYFGFHYNLGVLYYIDGQYQKAIDTLAGAMTVNPEISLIHNLKVAEKIFDSAKVQQAWVYRKGLEINEANENSLKIILQSYDHLKQYDRLYQAAQKSLGARLNDQGFFQFYAGKAALHLGLYKEAFDHFNDALTSQKDNFLAYKYLEEIYARIDKKPLFDELMDRLHIDVDQIKDSDLLDVAKVNLIYYIPKFEVGIIPLLSMINNENSLE